MIQQKTLDFLSSLKNNNERKWFQEHRDEYEHAKTDFLNMFDQVAAYCVDLDPHIINSKTDSHVFRINRDIRFSPNKNLYKKWFWGFICPRGRANKNLRPVYYVHIEPWNSFVAAWVRAPEREYLEAIREKISIKWASLKKILNKKVFKEYFWNFNQNDVLKTAPRWYKVDDEHIKLLRLKNFTVSHHLPDSIVSSKDIIAEFKKWFETAKPLNDWFNAINL